MERLKRSAEWFKNYLEHIENKGTKEYLKSIVFRLLVFISPTIVAFSTISDFFLSSFWRFLLFLFINICLFIIQEYINTNKIFNEEDNIRKKHQEELDNFEAEFSSRMSQLENENSSLHNELDAKSLECESLSLQTEMFSGIIESNIQKFIFQLSKKLKLTNKERISLYRRDTVESDFIILTRYSLNPHFDEINRGSYPSDEGFISKCWGNDPVFYIDNMKSVPSNPEEFKDYYREYYSNQGVKMSEELIKTSRMKSRSFYVRNILSDTGEKTVGVIVIESAEPLITGFNTEQELTNALNEDSLVMPYLYYLMNNKL